MRRFGGISALLLAGAGVLFPVAAAAYVRTAVGNTPSSQSTCEGGLIYLYWVPRNHPWWLYQDPANTSTLVGLPWTGVETAMQAATQTWEDVSCSDITFQYQGATSVSTIGYNPNASNNENVEIFREAACSTVVPAGNSCLTDDDCGDTYNCWGNEDDIIALTTTTFDNETGELVDADTEFNGTLSVDGFPYYVFTDTAQPVCTADAGTSDCAPSCPNPRDTNDSQMNCVATDVQNTATHEFGHFLGMAHTPDTAATMFAYAPPGQTSKRDLSPDDIAGICSIYPKGQQTDWCIPPASNSKSGCTSAAGADLLALGAAILGFRRRRR